MITLETCPLWAANTQKVADLDAQLQNDFRRSTQLEREERRGEDD